MYKFCDTTEYPQINPLPAEAVCFNDVWLDNAIPGFRTLAVEGREFVARTIDTYTVGNTDGKYYRSAAFDGRTITVQYQIITADQYEYREAFNVLNSILRVAQAKLIFADEPDKYFVATRASFGAVPTGRNSVVGTIQFYCADPKKYAVKEKEFEASAESGEVILSIRNDGTMPVPINYEIVCESDNGYIGIENGDDYIRFGDEDEGDGESIDTSELLIDFNTLLNTPDDPVGGVVQGTFQIYNLEGRQWCGHLVDTSKASGWHGARRTVNLPADKNGVVGAVNFTFYSFHWFQTANVAQRGRQAVKFFDAEGNERITFQISKENSSNSSAFCRHALNGVPKASFTFETGAKNNPFLPSNGHNSIEKKGGNIKMYYYGKNYSYYDPDLEDVAITKIEFVVYAYGSYAQITRNYVGAFSFAKDDVEEWRDDTNLYTAGSEVLVNGEEGKVYINGIPKLGDEIKGSEYFHAEPGQNAVSVYCSSWARNISVKAKIREAWI